MKRADEDTRLASLGRRDWRTTADVAGQTALYKTSVGTQTLRIIQAAALQEVVQCKGLFLHGRVGCGKTLISGLTGEALQAERPLLIVPGGTMKTDADDAMRLLRLHWKVPRHLRIVSYNHISNHPDWLRRNPTDCLICDEAHKLKDVEKSVAARNIYRFLLDNPRVFFAAMSGSLSPHGELEDYAHILNLSLRGRSPIPRIPSYIKAWSRAIDGSGDTEALLGAGSPAEAARFLKDQLAESPGCIISDDAFTDVPITITVTQHDAPECMREHYEQLRNFWQAPDGWTLDEESGQFGVAALSRQLSNGFFYRKDPRPPAWFLARVKAWGKYCKSLIEREVFDSSGAIKTAIRSGTLKGDGVLYLQELDEAVENFPMSTEEDWFHLETVRYAADWIKRTEGGVVWVKNIALGKALEKVTGRPFYNGQPDRDIVADQHGGKCIIASISANAVGKNLQYQYWNNLVLDPPANGVWMEQLLGRTHREGQTREVFAELYCSCVENYNAVKKSWLAAHKIEETLSPQKMTSIQLPRKHRQAHPAWMQAAKRAA